MQELYVNRLEKKKKPLHFELHMLIVYTYPSQKKKNFEQLLHGKNMMIQYL